MAENIQAHVAKIKAILKGETPQTTVETTTEAPAAEAVADVPAEQPE